MFFDQVQKIIIQASEEDVKMAIIYLDETLEEVMSGLVSKTPKFIPYILGRLQKEAPHVPIELRTIGAIEFNSHISEEYLKIMESSTNKVLQEIQDMLN